MGVPMVKKCCYCVNLHTGTLIIAYLYTVWALLELTAYCLLVTLAPLGKDGNISMHKYVLYVTAAVVSGVHLLCSLLLIVAAYKKLASLTLPWTIITGILTAIFFVMCLTGISLILQDSGETLGVEAVVIFVHLTRACVSVYCIVIVHSRHKQIMYEDDEKRCLTEIEDNYNFGSNSPGVEAKMGVPHITTFCWCMGLELGSKVIGYLHLLVSMSMVVVCSLSAASARAHMGLEEDGEERVYSRWFTAALVVAVASVVHILLAATLIYAVHKRNTCALVSWVRVMCALFVAALLYVLVSMVAFKAHGSGSEIFLAFLEGVLFFGILAYCILCVNSYYLVLKSTEDMVGPNKVEY
ncbi:unnamed protein product, partial [Iphiclides podalirius]